MRLALRQSSSLAPMLGVLALGALLIEALAATAVLSVVARGEAISDWIPFYGAGTLVRTGEGAHLYDPATQEAVQRQLFGPGVQVMGYTLPAFLAFLFAPLSRLTFAQSYCVWLAVNLTLLGALVRLAWGWLREVPAPMRAAFLACAALSLPAVDLLLLGQVDLLVLGGLAGCYVLLRAGRPLTAGSVLALALVKPHLAAGAVLLLLLKGQWRALTGLAAAAIPLLLGPALALGPRALLDQAALVTSYSGSSTDYAIAADMMVNVRGTVTSITGSSSVWAWLPLLSAVAAVALYAALRTWRSLPAAHPQSWALAFALPLLYSPHVHAHSMVPLAGAGALYLLDAARHRGTAQNAEWVLAGFVAVTALWLLSVAGVSLLALPIMGAYAVFVRRWPDAAAEPAARPERAALALAS